MKGVIYVLAERDTPIKLIGPHWLLDHLHYGQRVYDTAKEAEEGRQAGDAYENPNDTRVVGFELKSFLPKKHGKKHRGRG